MGPNPTGGLAVVHLADLLDLERLERHVADGYVKVQRHPLEDLEIYNYSHSCQWAQAWDAITMATRGLVVQRSTGVVQARPFPKFFNWDQAQVGKIPIGPMIKMPKMDGSLGVLYRNANGTLAMATRGSFTSDQAVRGTQLLHEIMKSYDGCFFEPQPDKTYLFEIIYPENRIVVDYKGESRLVLLDVVDTESGKSDLAAFDEAYWLDKVQRETRNTFDHSLAHEIRDDEEGFVLYWPFHDLRVKMKGAEYCRLHRVLTGVSTKTIWEYLSQGRSLVELIENVPDEFYDWVRAQTERLQAQYDARLAELQAEYRTLDLKLPAFASRKDFADLACRSPNRAALFAMLDNKPLDSLIWKELKPAYEKPFMATSEDVA